MGLKCKRAINRLMHKAKVTMAERMGVIAISQQIPIEVKPIVRTVEPKRATIIPTPTIVPKVVPEAPKQANNGIAPPKKVIVLPKR